MGDSTGPGPANNPATTRGAGESRWQRYYVRSLDRGPRPLLLAACDLLGSGEGRMAVDLGCGAGVDVLALLERGWSVTAIDQDPAGLDMLRTRVPAGSAGRARIVRAAYGEAVLPRAELVHASYSLPFCTPAKFPALWARLREALVPGGAFAGQLFGVRDSWASSADMSFHDRGQVEELLDGLEVIQLTETERDGEAVSGPKHWHVYDILVRKPA